MQKWLHWTIALLVIVMVVLGLAMTRLGEGEVTNTLYELHRSVGLAVLAFAVIRMGVRLSRGAPRLEPGAPGWQRAAARASHYGLYVLIVLVPLTGWSATSSCCGPVSLFWTVPLTLPVPGEEAFSKPVFWVHLALAFTLVRVMPLHVAGALHHHFIRRDATLTRMLPQTVKTREESLQVARVS